MREKQTADVGVRGTKGVKRNPSVKILVATHKPYRMPEDPLYVPLLVGANTNRWEDAPGNLEKDNSGHHISEKNPNFCELTGLYWAWKNLPADYLGLVHYRRHFADPFRIPGREKRDASRKKQERGQKMRPGNKWQRILTGRQCRKLLQQTDVLLPKPRHYWIETTYNQYAHAHHAVDLDTTREILEEKYPEYTDSFDRVMQRTTGHRFNMFVMKRELMHAYCTWLFDVLFELERRLDISNYSTYDARVFGFVGERLLDVWLETNGISYRELPHLFMERQNWLLKGGDFLRRKITAGRKKDNVS